MKRALILFAHGAREATWAEPFEALAARIRLLSPNTPVRLAFLELMEPDLGGAVVQIVAGGADTVRIVPIFFGQGGHLRRDLPALVATLREEHPRVRFECVPPVGEDDGVLDAIAAYCLREL
jgi:sirohydrochlorin cobaltochelatase